MFELTTKSKESSATCIFKLPAKSIDMAIRMWNEFETFSDARKHFIPDFSSLKQI